MNQALPLKVYRQLYKAYGPQQWWPADSPFEVMVGAILTQNTNWQNVEKAIGNLKANSMLTAAAIAGCQEERLAEIIRPSGYYRQKADRLRKFCRFFLESGQTEALKQQPLPELRRLLLALHGIGPETADSMLLYALDQPVFVVDAYTRRIFSRLGLLDARIGYEAIRHDFESQLEPSVPLFQEYHALIVEHAKRHCRVSPACTDCPLAGQCPSRHVD